MRNRNSSTPARGRHRAGMVRVRAKDLVETLMGALRAYELEQQIADAHRRGAGLRRVARACELAADRSPVPLDADRLADLVGELPQNEDGSLHEAAFLALLEVCIWDRRLAEAVAPASGGAR